MDEVLRWLLCETSAADGATEGLANGCIFLLFDVYVEFDDCRMLEFADQALEVRLCCGFALTSSIESFRDRFGKVPREEGW